MVIKAPEEAGPLSVEVYVAGGTEPIAASGGRGNPVAAGFCMEAQESLEPVELIVVVPERVPDGASAAVFWE